MDKIIISLLLMTTIMSANAQDSIALYGHIDSVTIMTSTTSIERPIKNGDHDRYVSVSDVLDSKSFGTLRSGGPAVLSTLLYRGYATRHLGLLWQGFNIQSPVNGTHDIGLLPMAFDRLGIVSSSSSASIGNASVAGALILESGIPQDHGGRIFISYGSDKNTNINLMSRYSAKKYKHVINAQYDYNNNQYVYDLFGDRVTQDKAKMVLYNINYNGYLSLSPTSFIELGTWWQYGDRNIPNTKTTAPNVQTQQDGNYRYSFKYDHLLNKETVVRFRTAYFKERLDYQSLGINSVSEADVYNLGLEVIAPHNYLISFQYRKDEVNANFYTGKRERTSVGLVGNKSLQWSSSRLRFTTRIDRVDTTFEPISLNIDYQYMLSPFTTLSFDIARGYTLPSLNDLYWPQGGNPDLLTETSLNTQLGLKTTLKTFTINSVLYHNNIDNWIQWQPGPSGFFQPENQKKIKNTGFELGLSNSMSIAGGKLSQELKYTFLDSRVADHYYRKDIIGKQNLFIPNHKGLLGLKYEAKRWQLSLDNIYYGKRYTTVDNTQSVNGYLVINGDAHVKVFESKKYKIMMKISVENITNTVYENIAFYPTPLRIWRGSMTFEW